MATSAPTGCFSHKSTFATISHTDGVLTVEFVGPGLAEREAKIVGHEIDGALRRSGKSLRLLVLDMGNIEIMSSIGLGVCIDARNAARAAGAETVVYRLCDQLQKLFSMTGVDRLYTMLQSEAELERRGGQIAA